MTTGLPASLYSPDAAAELARSVAALCGLGAGILGTSTLHIFFDLFQILCRGRAGLIVIGDIYPVARWGIERAAAGGVPAVPIAGLDPARVAWQAAAWGRQGLRPVLVTDGIFFPQGGIAPIADYAQIAAANHGLLVIDDTQALGILGRGPTAAEPYGRGGGGSFRHHDVGGPHLVLVASLAKAFGAPVAVLAGSERVVRAFAAHSATRRHNSPPTTVAIKAGLRALALNRRCGEQLRARLLDNVAQFRRVLAATGLTPDGGILPVQVIPLGPEADSRRVRAGLARDGIHALFASAPDRGQQALVMVITAAHRPAEITRAASTVAHLTTAHAASQARGRWIAGRPPALTSHIRATAIEPPRSCDLFDAGALLMLR